MSPSKTPPPKPTQPSLHLNWQDWLPYLEDSDASDAEKRQLIETLWSIILGFVDLGWEVGNGTPTTDETGGQTLDITDALRAAVLYSKEQDPEQEAP